MQGRPAPATPAPHARPPRPPARRPEPEEAPHAPETGSPAVGHTGRSVGLANLLLVFRDFAKELRLSVVLEIAPKKNVLSV